MFLCVVPDGWNKMTCLVELLCWFKNTLDHYNKAYSDDLYSALKSCFNLTRVQATQSLIAAVIKVYIPLIWTCRVLYQNHSRLGLSFYARQHVSSHDGKKHRCYKQLSSILLPGSRSHLKRSHRNMKAFFFSPLVSKPGLYLPEASIL